MVAGGESDILPLFACVGLFIRMGILTPTDLLPSAKVWFLLKAPLLMKAI